MDEIPIFTLAEISRTGAVRERLRSWLLHRAGAVTISLSTEQRTQIEYVLSVVRQFHGLPDEQRAALQPGGEFGAHGYLGYAANTGLTTERHYATYDMCLSEEGSLGDPLRGALLGRNRYPENREVSMSLRTAIRLMCNLTELAGKSIFSSVLAGFPGMLGAGPNGTCSQMRCLEYGKSLAPIGLGPHTDYELFSGSIADSPGLQVLDRAGDWLICGHGSSLLTLLVGDTLEALTGGVMESALHEVVRSPGLRYSAVFFRGLKFEASVRPPSSCSLTDYSFEFGPRLAGFMIRNCVPLRHELEASGDRSSLLGPAANPFRTAKLRRIRAS